MRYTTRDVVRDNPTNIPRSLSLPQDFIHGIDCKVEENRERGSP
jgi:hypothetical protein